MNRRILCVTSNFPRWCNDSTTPFVFHLAKDLIDLGWKIDVLAPHAVGTAPKEVMEGVGVYRFQYLWPAKLETVCYQGGALINLRRDKSNYLKLPFLIGAQWINMIKCLMRVEYDILHSHWILPQGFNGVLTSKVLKIPHVLTVHGGDVFGLRSRPLTLLKRNILHNADAVTTNSSVTEQAVLKIAPHINNLRRIPMGVSVHHRQQIGQIRDIRHRYLKGRGPLLVYAGRIVDEKGVADLIRAIEMLSRELSDVSAIIVGEGQDRAEMEALSSSLNLSQRVSFLGWVAPESMNAYLAAGDIFVGPSRQATDGWIEAQGLTFIEAMIAKTPVIATRVGGIVDSVKHENTGLLVKERSPSEIASAVMRLTADRSLRDRLVANGYSLARSHFSRPQTAKAFADLFQSLLAQHRYGNG